MTVAGKKAYKLYLTEEAADFITAQMEGKRGSGGLSAVVDEVIVNLYKTMKASGLDKGQKWTWANLAKFIIYGLKQ